MSNMAVNEAHLYRRNNALAVNTNTQNNKQHVQPNQTLEHD
jgi:hypothetical protein